jgi:hypothetical protein
MEGKTIPEVKGAVDIAEKKKLRYDLYEEHVIDQLMRDIADGKVSEGEQYILALEILNVIFNKVSTIGEMVERLRKVKEMPEVYVLFYKDLLAAFHAPSEEEGEMILHELTNKIALMNFDDTTWKYTPAIFPVRNDLIYGPIDSQYDFVISAIGFTGVFEWVKVLNWKYLLNEF